MKNENFSPVFENLNLSENDRHLVSPFFTNLDKSVFAITFLPPEVIGALCSRTSRAKEDLRVIFLQEFVKPFIASGDQYGKSLEALIEFLHKNPIELIFSNPKGREFYIKWLAQYGDDSIAQMAGAHLVYSGISQLAIKHFEDMRVGIAPIEKSTRYVDYSKKINGKYRYYIDPTFGDTGLRDEFQEAMDNLFETYGTLSGKFLDYLKKTYPEEEEVVFKTKTFDTLRGLLPVSTLSQVAFFANGQAFEYLVARSLNHPLGEVRWAGEEALEELKKIMPAFLRRVGDPASEDYRNYLSQRSQRIQDAMKKIGWQRENISSAPGVTLVDYDEDGENKIIAGLLYAELHEPWQKALGRVRNLSAAAKEEILKEVLKDRKFRWHRVPRAFENAYLRFEVVMNIGAWRDLHRHRMLTQYRERFNIHSGFDVPQDIKSAGLEGEFVSAVLKAENLFKKIEDKNPDLSQYCCCLAHRLRFVQYQNLRSFFWESELRTIPQGHPDYRNIEKEKIRQVQKIYPLIAKYLLADMADYDFARRKVTEQIKKKEEELENYFKKEN